VGDLIVDEYITCQPIGMSQEEPTIVVTPVDKSCFIGGAAIVAAHAAGLGASVKFISVTGNDIAAKFARTALEDAGVESNLMVDDSRPTPLKQRFRAGGKSLLRVNHLHQRSISLALQKELLGLLLPMVSQIDLLVFSDFNYGCLPQKIVGPIVDLAKSYGIVLAADSQSSSQVGDIGRFRGMHLITPTEREARISTRNQEDGLVVLSEQMLQSSDAQNILLKIGEEGVFINSQPLDTGREDRIAALNSSPQDLAGAGDSLLIASAMALASGSDIWEAACVGSIAAAVQVGRIGNTPLQRQDLLSVVQRLA
jgi:rfaE bifunctional protein kinase chain/domain